MFIKDKVENGVKVVKSVKKNVVQKTLTLKSNRTIKNNDDKKKLLSNSETIISDLTAEQFMT